MRMVEPGRRPSLLARARSVGRHQLLVRRGRAPPRLVRPSGSFGPCHDFDFEFGNIGRQSRQPTFGAGVSYGYSFRLNSRLSLDLSVRAGYTGGHITVYKPQCGTYVCVDSYYRRYIGPTDVSVTLVWFPGRGAFNNPER